MASVVAFLKNLTETLQKRGRGGCGEHIVKPFRGRGLLFGLFLISEISYLYQKLSIILFSLFND